MLNRSESSLIKVRIEAEFFRVDAYSDLEKTKYYNTIKNLFESHPLASGEKNTIGMIIYMLISDNPKLLLTRELNNLEIEQARLIAKTVLLECLINKVNEPALSVVINLDWIAQHYQKIRHESLKNEPFKYIPRYPDSFSLTEKMLPVILTFTAFMPLILKNFMVLSSDDPKSVLTKSRQNVESTLIAAALAFFAGMVLPSGCSYVNQRYVYFKAKPKVHFYLEEILNRIEMNIADFKLNKNTRI